MNDKDVWPSMGHTSSPFNNTKAAGVQSHLQPPVSQNIINKIACQIDNNVPETPTPNIESCRSMLDNMPELHDFESKQSKNFDEVPEGNSELNKLLNSGYKTLEKKGGEWFETGLQNNKKVILE